MVMSILNKFLNKLHVKQEKTRKKRLETNKPNWFMFCEQKGTDQKERVIFFLIQIAFNEDKLSGLGFKTSVFFSQRFLLFSLFFFFVSSVY